MPQSYTAGMALTLTPELEGRIERVVASGSFPDVQSAMEHAVNALEADAMLDAWPAAELQRLVDEGIESARNEPLVAEDEARGHMAALRATLTGE